MALKTEYSPKGKFVYPKFLVADTKFDAEGIYSVKLILDADTAGSFIEKIDAAIEASYQDALEKAETPAKKKKVKKADAPYSEVLDDDGNETGEIAINFKLKAKGKNSKTGETWDNSVKIYDARGRVIAGAKRKALKIGSGTVGKIAFQMNPFFTAQVGAGVSLRLLGAQIIELVEFGGGDLAFGAEEGGFDADDMEDGFGDESGEDQSDDGDDAGDDEEDF
ncbi:hypothetical protein ABIE64_002632 [Thalassospira sp. MBR-102]|uniref:hypothetical protein n=1 Tax=Thalassospira sp. MBR-102 TaxID=3156466 RepID=UPI00339A49A9